MNMMSTKVTHGINLTTGYGPYSSTTAQLRSFVFHTYKFTRYMACVSWATKFNRKEKRESLC